MTIFSFPVSYQCFFYSIAIAWSIFQGIAGYHYGVYIFNSANDKGKIGMHKFWATLAYPVHHAIFYSLCSLSGFVAWHIAYLLTTQIKECKEWANISSGTSAILIALSLLAISGISGALPRILYLGNRPV